MVVLTEAIALSKYGFNPNEKIEFEGDFEKQLESYATHVIEDLPVSNIYSYIFIPETQKIFTENGSELYIDPEERGGLPQIGTIKALKMSLANPDNLVFLYSPPGPVAFQSGTKYDKVPPYPSGQLYFFKKRQGEENIIDAIALSVGKDFENDVLSLFFGKNIPRFDDEVQKIVYYLSNPEVSIFSDFEELINLLDQNSHLIFYLNVHGQKFSFADIAEFLRLGIKGQIKPQNQKVLEIIEKIMNTRIERKRVEDIGKRIPGVFSSDEEVKNFGVLPYFQVLSAYFGGSSKPLVLGGSCGGTVVDFREVNQLIESLIIESLKDYDPLSTNWRRLSNKSLDVDKYGSREFECPHCHKRIRRPEDTLLEKCPYCQQNVRCD